MSRRFGHDNLPEPMPWMGIHLRQLLRWHRAVNGPNCLGDALLQPLSHSDYPGVLGLLHERTHVLRQRRAQAILTLCGTDRMLKTPHINFADRSFEADPAGTQVNGIAMAQETAQSVDGGYQGTVGIETVCFGPEAVGDRADGRSARADRNEHAQKLEWFSWPPAVYPDRNAINENFELTERVDFDPRRGRCARDELK
jgi:hypothetical protein